MKKVLVVIPLLVILNNQLLSADVSSLSVQIIHQFKSAVGDKIKNDSNADLSVSQENIKNNENMDFSLKSLSRKNQGVHDSYPVFEKNASDIKESLTENFKRESNKFWDNISQKDVSMLIDTIKSYLRAKKIKVAENKGDIKIYIFTNYLWFDSLAGYSFQSVDYKGIKNDREIFSGTFDQKFDCPKIDLFLSGKCDSHKIGKILGKDIVNKIRKK